MRTRLLHEIIGGSGRTAEEGSTGGESGLTDATGPLCAMFGPHIGSGTTEERMRKSWLAALALVGVSTPTLAADPNGDWLVATKSAVIRIAPCGDALCGNIAWTKGPAGNRSEERRVGKGWRVWWGTCQLKM